MPQSLVLGNGSLLVNFNNRALVRDFYFPYAGLENHSSKKIHQLGVWVDSLPSQANGEAGVFSWLTDPAWQIEQCYEQATMVGSTIACNPRLGIKLDITDIVYNERTIFIRKIIVTNQASSNRRIKVYLHQDFKISDSNMADTALFDPETHSILHYKGRRCFLINSIINKKPFHHYAIGMNDPTRGLKGTWMDAEDGELTGMPIEHGPVDSVVGLASDFKANGTKTIFYWIAAGTNIAEAKDLNQYVLKKTPAHLIETTRNYWRAWVTQQQYSFYKLPPEIITQFQHSLLVIRTQVDNHGSILAANDSDLLKYGKDTYSYVWGRDGALTALALDKAGFSHLTKRFYKFSRQTLTSDGYQLHKYLPDGSLASSWHPWVDSQGQPQLPIQEDETATILYSLWHHWLHHKDLEFIEEMYNPLIKRSAHFLMKYRDKTGLPLPSYDLWEEKRGVSTYTAASVYGGLIAAASFANLLGKQPEARKYERAALQIKKNILNLLWDEKQQYFIKQLAPDEGGIYHRDFTVDISSIYGIIKYKVLSINDDKVQKAIQKTRRVLHVNTEVGGYIRYEGDNYHRASPNAQCNPWIITTLWIAQFDIIQAKSEEDCLEAIKILQWVNQHSSPTGIIPEQLNPYTGEPLSVAPLTWSHAVLVETVIDYLYKLEELGVCKACVVPNYQ